VTPLIEAVGEGFEDIVRLLLQYSADTNIKTIQVCLPPLFLLAIETINAALFYCSSTRVR